MTDEALKTQRLITKARGHNGDLAAVRGFLRRVSDGSIDLDRLEPTYVRAGVDGPVRVLYEVPRGNAEVVRVAARRIGAADGRSTEAAINARWLDSTGATGFTRAALYAPSLRLLFQIFPADDRLPSLPTAVDGSAMRAFLGAMLAERAADARLTSVGAKVVRYKPGRKCLLRYDLAWEAGDRELPSVVWARVSRQSKFDRISTNLSRLHGAARTVGFDLPEPLGSVPALAMECFGEVSGVALFALTGRSDFPVLCRRVGESLRRFHTLDVEMDQRFETEAQAARLAENATEFAWLMPAAVNRIARLAREIAARLRALAPSPLSLIHRDFHGDNILVADGHLALVDFEDCAMGARADDVGSLWAHLRWQSCQTPDRSARIAAASAAFFDGYFRGEPRSLPIASFAAMHAFLCAHQSLRHLRNRARQQHALAMLTACEAALEGDLT